MSGKIIFISLALTLCVVLCGCGESNADISDIADAAKDLIEETEPSTTSGDIAQTVKIGDSEYSSYTGDGFSKDFPTEDKTDENGRKILEIVYVKYDSEYLIDGYTEYVYDKNGNVETETDYGTLCDFRCKQEYENDKHGNHTVSRLYDENGLYSVVKRKFSKITIRLESEEFKDVYVETFRTEYDSDNNITGKCKLEYEHTYKQTPSRKTYYDANDNITFVYDYDEDGAYTTMYTYENGKVKETKKLG